MSRVGRVTVIGLVGITLLGIGGLVAPADAEPSAPDQPGARGAVTARGADFNGDGYSDLAAAGDRDPEDSSLVGVIRVRYGSKDGLTTANAQVWTQETFGQKLGNEFGDTLATGDLDGDGYTDLAIGSPYSTVDGATTAGSVRVVYGSRRGLDTTRTQLWTLNTPGVLGTAARSDYFGYAVTIADFGGSPVADLAIGAPGHQGSGAVTILYGSSTGLTATGNQQWSQLTPGIAGRQEPQDDFGAELTAGNFGRSAQADLAIGVPFENLGGRDGAGAVNVLYGSLSGLTVTGAQRWSPATKGIPGGLAEDANFGRSLAAGHFATTAYDDLAIGAPWDRVSGKHAAGAVTVIRGGSAGLSARGSQRWTQASKGIAGKPGTYDFFGWSLAAADFGRADRGEGLDDLAVGASGERVGKVRSAGAVHVIYGSTKGLRASGSVMLSRATPGVLGTARRGAYVGQALTVGDFGRTSGGHPMTDLAVAGGDEGVNILYGTRAGLSTADDQFLTDLGFVLPGN